MPDDQELAGVILLLGAMLAEQLDSAALGEASSDQALREAKELLEAMLKAARAARGEISN